MFFNLCKAPSDLLMLCADLSMFIIIIIIIISVIIIIIRVIIIIIIIIIIKDHVRTLF